MKFLFLIPSMLFACSPVLKPYSADVNYLSTEAPGIINISSVGFGKNKSDAIVDAQKNVFNTILFKGLNGDQLSAPLVDNETTAKANRSDYFNKLFQERQYQSFIISSTETSDLIKWNGGKKISINMKINYNSLRRNLEQNQVIRRFGF